VKGENMNKKKTAMISLVAICLIAIAGYAVTETATNEDNSPYSIIFDGSYSVGAPICETHAPLEKHFDYWLGDDGNVYHPGDTIELTPEHPTMKLTAVWAYNTYTVTWVNYDDTVLETDTNVQYGTVPTYNGATPTRVSSSTTNYTFGGWNPTVTEIRSDMTFKATYSTSPIVYSVTKNIGLNTTIGGSNTATAGSDYRFNIDLVNGAPINCLQVIVTIGGVEYTPTQHGNTNFVISGEDITGNIVITTLDIYITYIVKDI